MARASLTASCSASARTASRSIALASSADRPETRSRACDLLLGRAGELLAGLVELALALEELAIALLEHLAALIELLVALHEAPLLGGQLVPAGPGLLLRLTGEAELLVLGLEDEFLLAGPRFGLDAAALRPGRPSSSATPIRLRADCAEYGADRRPPRGRRPRGPAYPSSSSHPDRFMRPDASRVRWHDRDEDSGSAPHPRGRYRDPFVIRRGAPRGPRSADSVRENAH